MPSSIYMKMISKAITDYPSPIMKFLGLPEWYWIISAILFMIILLYLIISFIKRNRTNKISNTFSGIRITTCSKCGSAVDRGKDSCHVCKRRFLGDLYICPKCGCEIPEGSDDCQKCDSKMVPIKRSTNGDNEMEDDEDMKKLSRDNIDKRMIECPRCNALYDDLVDVCPVCKKVS